MKQKIFHLLEFYGINTGSYLLTVLSFHLMAKLKGVTLKELLQQQYKYGFSYFANFCMIGNLKVVKFFIKNGLNANQKILPRQRSPLIYAAKGGQLQVVKYLISKGADVNQECDDDKNALMYAVRNNSFKTTKYLVENTDSKFISKEKTRTVLIATVRGIFFNQAKKLKNIKNLTSFKFSITEKDFKILKYLLEYGIKDQQTITGETALKSAEEYSLIEVISLLKKYR